MGKGRDVRVEWEGEVDEIGWEVKRGGGKTVGWWRPVEVVLKDVDGDGR